MEEGFEGVEDFRNSRLRELYEESEEFAIYNRMMRDNKGVFIE